MAKRVAEKVTDPRALEGFLLKLSTVLSMSNQIEINESIIDKTLGAAAREEKSTIHPDDVVREICNYYNIKPTQLKGTKRDAALVKARHVCMFLLKENLRLTLVEIGNLLGGRDHTTIMHGIEKIGVQKEISTSLNDDIKNIMDLLQEK